MTWCRSRSSRRRARRSSPSCLENGPSAIAETKALALELGGARRRSVDFRSPRREPCGETTIRGGRRRARLLRRQARGPLERPIERCSSELNGLRPRSATIHFQALRAADLGAICSGMPSRTDSAPCSRCPRDVHLGDAALRDNPFARRNCARLRILRPRCSAAIEAPARWHGARA